MEQNTTDEEKRLANPKYGYVKKNKPKKEKSVIVEERTKPEELNGKINPVYFATLSTGLEIFALDEVEEKLHPVMKEKRRGKIIFEAKDVQNKLGDLKAVDTVYSLVHVEQSEFDANKSKTTSTENKSPTEQLEQLMNRAKNWNWDRALELWRELHPNEEIRFRVTCKRSGVSSKGEYGSSVDIAKYIGGALIDKYKWPVDLHKHTLEVYIHVREDEMIVGIALTDELLSWRYNDAGKGLLKSSIAYCMCRLADLKPGSVMMDPMCGNGVVLLEAATSWPDPTIKFIASDLDENQIQQANTNVNTLKLSDRITVMQMDASHMTLKDSSVDSIVSDIPFGKRHKMNPDLYVEMLAEMWRVTKHEGNIVLLTSKKNLMLKSVQKLNRKLKTNYKYFVNIGGLDAFIFHLQCIKPQQQ